ncbi:MAG: ABC transporter permease [Vicinamibacteria bacterium]
MDTWIQDFGHALLTLALGIGANTAIFAVVNGVLLKPLAYPEPGDLVLVTSQFPQMGFDQFWVSPPEFLELQERSRSFRALGAYTTGEDNLGTRERPRRVRVGRVTGDVFDALGVAPLLGRTFRPEETSSPRIRRPMPRRRSSSASWASSPATPRLDARPASIPSWC